MPNLTRRSAVTFGIGAFGLAALAVISQPSLALAATRLNLLAPADPVRSNFAGFLGQVFRAESEGTTVALTLTEVRDLVPTAAPDDELRFSLIFEPTDAPPEQGIYLLSRDGSAPTSLFLSPIGAHDGPATLQAVVDRQD